MDIMQNGKEENKNTKPIRRLTVQKRFLKQPQSEIVTIPKKILRIH